MRMFITKAYFDLFLTYICDLFIFFNSFFTEKEENFDKIKEPPLNEEEE